uniref:Uncharacterized protein n=1 Tax=Anguilla anguilla TaxID=7936 RepID=A0A0E9STS6_ANGAN
MHSVPGGGTVSLKGASPPSPGLHLRATLLKT